MEFKLKESEEKYREIIDNLDQGYYEVDLKGNYTFTNKFYANYLGYSKDELVGINFGNFFDKETEKRIFETYNEVFRKNLPKSSIEVESLGVNGIKRVFEATIYFKYDPYGKKIGFYGTTYDITERKKAEKEIANLAKFPSENPNPVLRVTSEKILYINQAGMRLFEIQEGNALPESLKDSVDQAIKEGTNQILDINLNNRIYSFAITPIRNEVYVNIYGNDITERKKAEAEIASLAKFPSENPNPILRVKNKRIVYINQAGQDLFKNIEDNRIPELLQDVIIEAFTENVIKELEIEIFNQIYSFVITPIKEAGYTNIYGRNITMHKKAEKEIQLERDNFKNILNSMEDGVYIVNQQNDIEFVNTILMKDFGPYKEKKCFKYFHDRKEICPWCKNQYVFLGKTVRWEWNSFKNKRTYDLIDTPLKNPDGSTSKLEIFRDITDLKEAEQKLKESEVKMRLINYELETVIDSIPALVFIKDENGRFIRVNQYLADYFNLTKEEIIGKFNSDFFPKEQAEIFRKIGLEVINSGKPKLNFLELWEGPSGSKWWLASIIPRNNDKNEAIGIIGFVFDMTKQKLAGETIRERNKEILALLDASRAVLQYRDFENVARSIFEICANLTRATAGYIGLLTPDRKGIRMIFLDPGEFTCEADPEIPIRIIGLRKEVIKSRKTLYQNDFSETDFIKFLPKEHLKLDNILIAPLIFNNEVQGFLDLANKPEGFNEVDLRRATAFSEIASIALMNYQTLQSLEKSEQKYRNLSNILEHKVDERTYELKESQEKIQNLINNISDALMEADQDGTITYFSPQIFDISGYHPDELLGHNFIKYIHPEDLPSYKIAARHSLKTKEPVSIECRIQHKKGFYVPVSTKAN